MENPEDFTIKCSGCGSTHTHADLSVDGWLSTCQDCFKQDILTDEALAKARQAGRKTITGKPLVSGGRAQKPKARGNIFSPLILKPLVSGETAQKSLKTGVESPLIADARRRAGETKTTNPLIANAKKRAETHKMEAHHV